MKHKAWATLGLLAACSAHAASFDCVKASTPVEKRVCANETLSRLDEAMSAMYRRALAKGDDPAQIRRGQVQWLKQVLAKCKSDACVNDAYAGRLNVLMSLAHAQTKIFADKTLGIEFAYPGNLEVERVDNSLYVQQRESDDRTTLLIDIVMDGTIPVVEAGQPIKGEGWTGVSNTVLCGIHDENGTHMSDSCLEAVIDGEGHHVGFTEMSEAYQMDLDAESVLNSIRLMPGK